MSAIEAKITQLEGLLAKASKGPWEVETELDPDAEYGPGPDPGRGYDDFIVFDGIGQLLFGTATSNAKCIVEEPYGDEDGYVQAWDEVGKANVDLIVEAVNSLPLLISALKEARSALEPFAALAASFGDKAVVEICEPHPDNPSPQIEPFRGEHFRRARKALTPEPPHA